DDRGDAHRDLPVVVVPPDAVAAVDLALRGSLLRLDAVDVVEPVDAPAGLQAARDAVDRLHEAASEARVDVVEAALQQLHHGLVLDALRLARLERGVAEVARHGDRDVSGPLPRPQAAAGGSPRPVPKGPLTSAAPVVPARRPTL